MNLIKSLHPEDRAHCYRVAALSQLLARLAGYKEKEVRTIYQSALFHDIGKIAIPLTVLHKPTSLSEREMAIVQTHTTIGAEMLKHWSSSMPTAAIVARQHHERLDGTGYLGMKRTQIHHHAKLVMVADVFDALISSRSYKAPWDVPSICFYLDNLAGTQFDSDIVELLLNHIEQVLELYQGRKTHKEKNVYLLCIYAP